jgi:pimeloyl-ACP methyl ester carboxylesterase
MSISTSLGEVRELQVEGATLRYRETGQGSPLLFVHGLAVNGDLWRNVVPTLSSRYRCITPDLPLGSHELPVDSREALSPRGVARMLADMITRLELHDVTVVANDTGGAITQLLITEHPGVVSRVVLTPCDCFENFLPPAFKPLQLLGRSAAFWWLAGQALRMRPLLRTPFAFGMLMHGVPPRDVAESWLGPVRRSAAVRRDLATFVRRIDSRDTVAAGALLHEFAGPVLIAWADGGRGFPQSYGRRLAEAFGERARMVVVENSRTFVPEDQPAALATLIADFVAATPDGTAQLQVV